MGDGNRYAHYEEQLEINCAICHSPKPGTTRKKRQLNNIVEEDGGFRLVGKLDGKKHPLNLPKKGACDYPGHRRLTCESCHSGWVPQCYRLPRQTGPARNPSRQADHEGNPGLVGRGPLLPPLRKTDPGGLGQRSGHGHPRLPGHRHRA